MPCPVCGRQTAVLARPGGMKALGQTNNNCYTFTDHQGHLCFIPFIVLQIKTGLEG